MEQDVFFDNFRPLLGAMAQPHISHPEFPEGVPLVGAGYANVAEQHLGAIVFDSSIGLQAKVLIADTDPFSRGLSATQHNLGQSDVITSRRFSRRPAYYRIGTLRIEGLGDGCNIFVPVNPSPQRIVFRGLHVVTVGKKTRIWHS